MRGRALLALGALFAGAPALAHPPRGIVAAADGTIYFSDLANVHAIGPGGSTQIVRRAQGAHIHALALSADGSLWGEESAYDPADGSYREGIWRCTPQGRVSWRYGPTKTIERGVGLLRDRRGCTWHLDQAFAGGPALVIASAARGPRAGCSAAPPTTGVSAPH